MKLAVVAAVGSYTAADLEHKKQSLRTVLRPDTQLDMCVADSGVPYVESSLELYLSEVAVARKVVEVAGMGYDAVVGTAFLDNGLDAARELVAIPVVGPAKTTMYMAATLAHKFGVITAAGDLPRHIWALAKLLGVVDRVVGIPTLKCTVADFLHDRPMPWPCSSPRDSSSWKSRGPKPSSWAAVRPPAWPHAWRRPWVSRCSIRA
jgi:Asp/Glu/hydantoin racemase